MPHQPDYGYRKDIYQGISSGISSHQCRPAASSQTTAQSWVRRLSCVQICQWYCANK
ncbi:unnamed protein product [Ixodes pacificus]